MNRFRRPAGRTRCTLWPRPCPPNLACAAEGEWVSLFDGKTLSGWTKAGTRAGNWEVKDGAIVGTGTLVDALQPQELQELQVPGRAQDQRPRQLGHVLPLPDARRRLQQGLRGPGRQHPPRPDPDRLDLHLRSYLQSDRSSRHLVHLRDGMRRPGSIAATSFRTSRSRSTASCSTSSWITATRGKRATSPSSSTIRAAGSRSARSRSWSYLDDKSGMV